MIDIIVTDEDYNSLTNKYKELGEYFETVLESYCNIMGRVVTEGVKEGYTHQNLLAFTQQACSLKKQLSTNLNELSVYSTDYVGAIDEADDFLY